MILNASPGAVVQNQIVVRITAEKSCYLLLHVKGRAATSDASPHGAKDLLALLRNQVRVWYIALMEE